MLLLRGELQVTVEEGECTNRVVVQSVVVTEKNICVFVFVFVVIVQNTMERGVVGEDGVGTEVIYESDVVVVFGVFFEGKREHT